MFKFLHVILVFRKKEELGYCKAEYDVATVTLASFIRLYDIWQWNYIL